MTKAEQPKKQSEAPEPVMELSSDTSGAPPGEKSERPLVEALRRLGCAVLKLLRRTHLLDPHTWLRTLLTLLYAVWFFVLFAVLIWFLVLCQILSTLIFGRPNRDLVEFSPKCGRYAQDLLTFLTYADDYRPWPLSSSNAEERPDAAGERKNPARARGEKPGGGRSRNK